MGVFKKTLIALRDKPQALRRILIAINLFSLADFALTVITLEAGGHEVNPVLRGLFALSPLWAGIFKVVVLLAATLLLWQTRRYRKSLIAALLMLLVFALLLVYDVAVVVLVSTHAVH